MTAYDSRKTIRVDFNPVVERDALKARRAQPRFLQGRRVVLNGRRYVAYSADELIAFDTDNMRPGFPV